jgi:cation:H+ antiporter
LGMLISAKVNQWTLLVGSLPIAYLVGGGSTSLVLDGRQLEELVLTATQTLMGVAILLVLRFPGWAAWTLFALFGVQFIIPGTQGRYLVSIAYGAIALVLLVHHRREILPTLTAPFRRRPVAAAEQRDRALV